MVILGKSYMVISFATNSDAMRAQSIFQNKKLSGRLIPTPIELSAQCGLAWRNEISQQELCQKIIMEEKICYQKIAILNL